MIELQCAVVAKMWGGRASLVPPTLYNGHVAIQIEILSKPSRPSFNFTLYITHKSKLNSSKHSHIQLEQTKQPKIS
jgi:hypothetical protein